MPPPRPPPGNRRTACRNGPTAPSWSRSRGGRCCATPERTSATLSITFAMSGSFSPIVRPGTTVWIDVYLPRMSSGRFGLEVEAIVVRNAAAEEDENDRLARGRTLLSAWARPSPASARRARVAIIRRGRANRREGSRGESDHHNGGWNEMGTRCRASGAAPVRVARGCGMNGGRLTILIRRAG